MPRPTNPFQQKLLAFKKGHDGIAHFDWDLAFYFKVPLGTWRNWTQGRRVPHKMIQATVLSRIKEANRRIKAQNTP